MQQTPDFSNENAIYETKKLLKQAIDAEHSDTRSSIATNNLSGEKTLQTTQKNFLHTSNTWNTMSGQHGRTYSNAHLQRYHDSSLTLPLCQYSPVSYNVSLRRGKDSGYFTDQGIVKDTIHCGAKCCRIPSCDVAFMLKNKCFTVECHRIEYCTPVEAVRLPFPTAAIYIIRERNKRFPISTTPSSGSLTSNVIVHQNSLLNTSKRINMPFTNQLNQFLILNSTDKTMTSTTKDFVAANTASMKYKKQPFRTAEISADRKLEYTFPTAQSDATISESARNMENPVRNLIQTNAHIITDTKSQYLVPTIQTDATTTKPARPREESVPSLAQSHAQIITDRKPQYILPTIQNEAAIAKTTTRNTEEPVTVIPLNGNENRKQTTTTKLPPPVNVQVTVNLQSPVKEKHTETKALPTDSIKTHGKTTVHRETTTPLLIKETVIRKTTSKVTKNAHNQLSHRKDFVMFGSSRVEHGKADRDSSLYQDKPSQMLAETHKQNPLQSNIPTSAPHDVTTGKIINEYERIQTTISPHTQALRRNAPITQRNHATTTAKPTENKASKAPTSEQKITIYNVDIGSSTLSRPSKQHMESPILLTANGMEAIANSSGGNARKHHINPNRNVLLDTDASAINLMDVNDSPENDKLISEDADESKPIKQVQPVLKLIDQTGRIYLDVSTNKHIVVPVHEETRDGIPLQQRHSVISIRPTAEETIDDLRHININEISSSRKENYNSISRKKRKNKKRKKKKKRKKNRNRKKKKKKTNIMPLNEDVDLLDNDVKEEKINGDEDNSNSNVGNEGQRKISHKKQCIIGDIQVGVTLIGGMKAGIYTEKGLVANPKNCARLCCTDDTCDLAFTIKKKCFAVSCFSEELCDTVKAKYGRFKTAVVFVNKMDRALKAPTTQSLLEAIYDNKMNHGEFESCEAAQFKQSATLSRQLHTGEFIRHGEVSNDAKCVKICCEEPRCDAAFMLENFCYTLKCFDNLCDTNYLHDDVFHPRIAIIHKAQRNLKKSAIPTPPITIFLNEDPMDTFLQKEDPLENFFNRKSSNAEDSFLTNILSEKLNENREIQHVAETTEKNGKQLNHLSLIEKEIGDLIEKIDNVTTQKPTKHKEKTGKTLDLGATDAGFDSWDRNQALIGTTQKRLEYDGDLYPTLFSRDENMSPKEDPEVLENQQDEPIIKIMGNDDQNINKSKNMDESIADMVNNGSSDSESQRGTYKHSHHIKNRLQTSRIHDKVRDSEITMKRNNSLSYKRIFVPSARSSHGNHFHGEKAVTTVHDDKKPDKESYYFAPDSSHHKRILFPVEEDDENPLKSDVFGDIGQRRNEKKHSQDQSNLLLKDLEQLEMNQNSKLDELLSEKFKVIGKTAQTNAKNKIKHEPTTKPEIKKQNHTPTSKPRTKSHRYHIPTTNKHLSTTKTRTKEKYYLPTVKQNAKKHVTFTGHKRSHYPTTPRKHSTVQSPMHHRTGKVLETQLRDHQSTTTKPHPPTRRPNRSPEKVSAKHHPTRSHGTVVQKGSHHTTHHPGRKHITVEQQIIKDKPAHQTTKNPTRKPWTMHHYSPTVSSRHRHTSKAVTMLPHGGGRYRHMSPVTRSNLRHELQDVITNLTRAIQNMEKHQIEVENIMKSTKAKVKETTKQITSTKKPKTTRQSTMKQKVKQTQTTKQIARTKKPKTTRQSTTKEKVKPTQKSQHMTKARTHPPITSTHAKTIKKSSQNPTKKSHTNTSGKRSKIPIKQKTDETAKQRQYVPTKSQRTRVRKTTKHHTSHHSHTTPKNRGAALALKLWKWDTDQKENSDDYSTPIKHHLSAKSIGFEDHTPQQSSKYTSVLPTASLYSTLQPFQLPKMRVKARYNHWNPNMDFREFDPDFQIDGSEVVPQLEETDYDHQIIMPLRAATVPFPTSSYPEIPNLSTIKTIGPAVTMNDIEKFGATVDMESTEILTRPNATELIERRTNVNSANKLTALYATENVEHVAAKLSTDISATPEVKMNDIERFGTPVDMESTEIFTIPNATERVETRTDVNSANKLTALHATEHFGIVADKLNTDISTTPNVMTNIGNLVTTKEMRSTEKLNLEMENSTKQKHEKWKDPFEFEDLNMESIIPLLEGNDTSTSLKPTLGDFLLPANENNTINSIYSVIEDMGFSKNFGNDTFLLDNVTSADLGSMHFLNNASDNASKMFVLPTRKINAAQDIEQLDGNETTAVTRMPDPESENPSMTDIAEIKLHRNRTQYVKKSKVPLEPIMQKGDIALNTGATAELVHYGFENYKLNEVNDDSGNNINAVLVGGARVTRKDSKCGASVDLQGGEIVISSQTLKDRQIEAITVALWVKVKYEEDNLSLFNIDAAPDGTGSVFILEIKDGKIHWTHLDENRIVIFDLLTLQKTSMPPGLWSHVAATYDSHKGQAKLFVDTQLIKSEPGAGRMSSVFKGKVSIGNSGTLPGLVDEFYLFQKPLSFSDIKDLSELCNIGADYPIPMDAGAYTGILTDSEIKASNLQLAHRHSKVEVKNGPDKSDEDNLIPEQCKKQAVLYNTDISGGKTAGIFTDVGDIMSIDACIQKCCVSPRCHVAYLEKKRCYNVICHFPSLCQPVKAGRALVTLGYVIRDGESVYHPDLLPTTLPMKTTETTRLTSTIKPEKHKCLQSMVYYGVALRGGWTAGKFTDMGVVPSLQNCVALCCNDSACDLSILIGQKCFTIRCYNIEDCQTVPNGHAQIAYISREGFPALVPTKPVHAAATRYHATTNGPTNRPGVTFSPSISGKRSDLILHLSFDRMDEDEVLDDSGYNNNAKLTNGANISPGGGIRGNGIIFQGGEVILDGENFNPKPKKAITISLWVKLQDIDGKHSLFTSFDGNKQTTYHFEIIDGRVRWFHRNQAYKQIFYVETSPVILRDTWHNIIVTFDSDSGEAKIYVDGGIKSIGIGHGDLSLDWSSKVGFGVHQGGKALHGFMDDVYMYTTALYRDEIVKYVKSFKEKHNLKTPPLILKVTHKVTRHPPTQRPSTQHKTTKHHTTSKPTHKLTHSPKHPSTKHFTPHLPSHRPTRTHHRTTVKKKPTTYHKSSKKPKTRPKTTTTATRPTTKKRTSTTRTTPITTTTLTTPSTTTRKSSPIPSCKFGNTYQYTDLKGGLSSGNFLDRGLTPGIYPCMGLCCSHRTCDLAYVISGRCYLVECYTEELCSIVPKGVGLISPIIGMVVRPGGPKIPELSAPIVMSPTIPTTTRKQHHKPPETLNDFNELELELGSSLTKPTRLKNQQCIFGKTLNHTTFIGGLKAGNFTNKGVVTSMKLCQDLCCKETTCDVAVMMKHACFLVACKTEDLCKPRKAQLDHFSLILAYRDRKTDEDVEVMGLARTTSKPHSPTRSLTKQITTARRTTYRTTVGRISNDTSEEIPTALVPNKDVKSWCIKGFILNGVELVGGLKSGPYHKLGKVKTMTDCVKKCCNIADCTVAYFDQSHCYAVRCLDKKLCKTKMAGTQDSVAYVVRNGWSLFKSEEESLDGATFSSNSKSSDSNDIEINSVSNKTTEVIHSVSHSDDAQGNNFGYCEKKETLTEHRLIAGMKSGVFTEHGDVSDFDSCVMYCCRDRSCDVAYMVDKTCYSIKCFSFNFCKTFKVPKFFLNPILAFVSRTQKTHKEKGNGTLVTPKEKYINQTIAIDITPGKAGNENTKHLFYSDHEVISVEDKKLKGIMGKKKGTHKQIGGISHFNSDRGKKRHKQTTHHVLPQKKKSVPFQNNYIQKLVHQILGEESSGFGESHVGFEDGSGANPTSGIYHSGFQSGFGDQLGDESGFGINQKPITHMIHTSQVFRHSKKKHHRHHRHHHKKMHKQKYMTYTQATIKPTTTTTTTVSTLATTASKHYYLMDEVDIETIQALSPDKQYTTCDAKSYQCEHFCISLLHGGYRCMCRKGFKLALDGKHCLYQGVCDRHAHHCDQACEYEGDEITCVCRSGFIMMKTMNDSCEDMDECAMGIHGCSDVCVNTPGSYICQCKDSYVLAPDRMGCDHIESVGGTKKNFINHPERTFSIPAMILVPPNGTEVTQGHNVLLRCKTRGSPTPTIVWSYGDNFTAAIRDNSKYMLLPGGNLLIQDTNVNDTGRYTCISSNVAGTDTANIYLRVNDINECKDGVQRCDQVCYNTYGSFKCGCYRGYSLMDDQVHCQDTNECDHTNDCNHYCWNTPGSYACGCKNGYQLAPDNKHCEDIDECIDKPHVCSQICNNTNGGFICACTPGYNISTADNKTCEKLQVLHTHEKLSLQHKSKQQVVYIIILTTSLIVTIMVIGGSLIFLIRNYKKRWKLREESTNSNVPPIHTRSSAIYSWNY